MNIEDSIKHLSNAKNVEGLDDCYYKPVEIAEIEFLIPSDKGLLPEGKTGVFYVAGIKEVLGEKFLVYNKDKNLHDEYSDFIFGINKPIKIICSYETLKVL